MAIIDWMLQPLRVGYRGVYRVVTVVGQLWVGVYGY